MGDKFFKKTEEAINLGITFLFIIGFVLLIYFNAQPTGLAIKDFENNASLIVTLKDKSLYFENDTIKSQQDKFVKINNLTLDNDYDNINAIAVIADKSDIEKILNDPNVESISLDQEFKITLDSSAPVINANQVWDKKSKGINLTGKGQSICILDTGADYNHLSLSGRIILGPDFVNDDNDPLDDNGHGTHVAGIAVSGHETYKGIANEANAVAVKVMSSGGGGTGADIIDGIDWCINNKDVYNITVISMSIGSSTLFSDYCDNVYQALTDIINEAVGNNILVVSSASNDHSSSSLPLPACIKNVTSIGAADDSDNVASFSNSAWFLDLLAPGVSITSTYPGQSFRTLSGTSMSAPHASSLALILKQYSVLESIGLNVFGIESTMKNTGKDVIDSRNGLTFKRIDVYKALLSLDNFKPELSYDIPALTYDDHDIYLTASASDTFLDSVWLEIGNNTYFTDNYILTNLNAGENVTFRFGANDSAGNSITGNYISFTVLDGRPILNNIEKLTAKLNYAFNYNVIAQDPTNDSLTYSDDTELFNITENGLISFIPTAVGNHTVNISISDGKHLVSDTFLLETLANNSKPNITSHYPLDLNFVLNENESLLFNITKEDLDDTTLNVNWHLDNNLASTNDNYLYQTNYLSAGSHNITVLVSDGIDSDSVEWNIIVNNVDLTPVLVNEISNLSWNENTNYSLNMSSYFTDLDGDRLTYNNSLAENITVHINSDIIILEPDREWNGIRTIKFYAFDTDLHYAESNSVILNINNVPACGNNILEGSEECDNTNLNNLSCLSRGYTGGTLSCSECKLNYALCTITVSSSGGGASGGGGTPLETKKPEETKITEKKEEVKEPVKTITESNKQEQIEEKTVKPKISPVKAFFVKTWSFAKKIYYIIASFINTKF